jgi:hypothetical protein
MKRIFATAVAIAALASAIPAYATDFFPSTTLNNPDGTGTGSYTFAVTSGDPTLGTQAVNAFFSRTKTASGTFTDTFRFFIGLPLGAGNLIGLGAGNIGTTFTSTNPADAQNLDFQSVSFFNGVDPVFNIITQPTAGDPNGESGSASGIPIYRGIENILSVTYTARGNGTFSGNLFFTPVAVPEPATWAMMLAGFGAIGFTMRRRRKPQSQVRFAF